MNPSIRYFVRFGGEDRGPFDVARLRQLADVGTITSQTEAAERSDGPWVRLAALPAHDEIFVSRPKMAFGEAKFVATPDAPDAVDLREVIAASNNLERVLRPSHPPDLAAHLAAKAAAAPNEIEAMVRDVQAREAQFSAPPPPPRRWRPKRNLMLIVTLAVLGNGLLAAIMTYYEGWNHDASTFSATGLVAFFNVGLLAWYHMLPKE